MKKTKPAQGGNKPSAAPISEAAAKPTNPKRKDWATVYHAGELIEIAPPGTRLPKTKLTKKQLREFEQLLLSKRRELVGDVLHMTDEALHNNRNAGISSTAPYHMADVGSDNWEQEFTLGLLAGERALVREIDEAISRIADRTYGTCLATHRPIDLSRLRAKPWAKYCIVYARLRELGRIP